MSVDTITVLFPIDLYENTSYIKNTKVFLVEEELYFNRNTKALGSMHLNVLKPLYHRATMKSYYDKIKSQFIDCTYIELKQNWVEIVKKNMRPTSIVQFFDPVDRYLENKIKINFKYYDIIDTPRFIFSSDELIEYTGPLKQTSFYMWGRDRKHILIDKNGDYYGNRLTYDTQNKKSPYRGIQDDMDDSMGSDIDFNKNKYVESAFKYVKNNIKSNDLTLWSETGKDLTDYVNLSDTDIMLKFPIDSKGAKGRLKYFIKNVLEVFGDYQDVFLDTSDDNSSFIFHSGLSPMMNIGLLTPSDVLDSMMDYFNNLSTSSKKKQIHNCEGFIRQILGWREFTRYVYEHHSDKYLNKNHFNANLSLSSKWYNGTVGIEPIDLCIKKAFKYGYLHHIERLMIVANYMTLLKINPIHMFRWFTEFSLDSYNWVMEFNIYSMGSYSDGGIFTSKPYISGSNYLLKMSNYRNTFDKNASNWADKWDLMFWNFIADNKNKLNKIGRLSFLIPKAKKRIAELKKKLIHV